MSFLIVYLLLVLLTAGLGLVVVLAFWQYRFRGDRTGLIVALFAIAFVSVIAGTLILINPSEGRSAVIDQTFL